MQTGFCEQAKNPVQYIVLKEKKNEPALKFIFWNKNYEQIEKLVAVKWWLMFISFLQSPPYAVNLGRRVEEEKEHRRADVDQGVWAQAVASREPQPEEHADGRPLRSLRGPTRREVPRQRARWQVSQSFHLTVC